jgi:glycosyltransferase involved in cell wall biosynthesis
LEVGLSALTKVVIAVSECERNHLVRLGIAPGKVVVVPNGVPRISSDSGRRAAIRRRLGIDGKDMLIGFVGRLEKQKRVDSLLLSLRELTPELLSKMRLAVVGGGSLDCELKALAMRLGLHDRVVWTGEVESACEYMTAFDVFSLASDYEAMPYALLEAVAAGLPVVSTDVGGVSEIVRDGWNGRVVEPGNVRALSAALAAVAGSSAAEFRAKAAAIAVGDRFSLDCMISRTVSVYSQALAAA